MGEVVGKVPVVITIKGNGIMVVNRVKAFIIIKTAHTKASFLILSNMATARNSSKTGMSIRACTKRANLMESVSIPGMMEHIIRESSVVAIAREKALCMNIMAVAIKVYRLLT